MRSASSNNTIGKLSPGFFMDGDVRPSQKCRNGRDVFFGLAYPGSIFNCVLGLKVAPMNKLQNSRCSGMGKYVVCVVSK